jgi:DivIVA domain-containing protein
MADDSNLLTARQVESATFKTSIRGYDPGEVDAFVDKIIESLSRHESGRRGGREIITSDQITVATFSTTLRGYDLNGVDDFLDDVVATLRHYESGGRLRRNEANEPAPRKGTRSAPFKRRASLPSQAKRPQPSPSDIETDAEQPASIPDDDVVEEYRPRSSDELLEQAKKWLDRS